VTAAEPAALSAASPEGPGAVLRRAREARGLTEQQAAERLNLDAGAVVAMERGDFAALGAPVFARGHLRRYGTLLGVPEEALLDSYEQARTHPEQPSLVPHSRIDMAPVRNRPAWPWAVGGTVAFLLVGGLIGYLSEFGPRLPAGVAAWFDRGSTGAEVDSAVADPRQPPTGVSGSPDDRVGGESLAASTGSPGIDLPAMGDVPSIGPAPVAPPPGAAAPVSDVAGPAAGTATTTAAPPAGQLAVSLAFAADSWAEIYDGTGQTVLYDLGRAGTERALTAAAPISVTIGNAPGVTLAVNGRRVALPPRPSGGTVARFTIAADGTLR
jgi:cytoskeleton protein RodZ